ncbi:MAG: SDR family NAD(P)-dependent oxidoreductase [Candidatus Heimdallarchaeota archaeon]
MRVTELFDLKGTRGLVTGGATGIGFTMAQGLAEVGADVAICGRGRHGSLEEAVAKLSEFGTEVIGKKCDVSVEDDVKQMITELADQGFSLNTLVNNAGISWGCPSEKLPLNDFTKVVAVNLTGTFLVSRETAKKFMIPGQSGSIINISSTSGFLGGEIGIAGYSASKAGVLGLTRQLAVEWVSHGIRVNAICPSWFPSYMSRHFTGKESPVRNALMAENPMGRFGEPWELKGVIVFLASKASSYINGVAIPIDGGLLVK